MVIPDLPLEIQHPDSIVKVLVPDEVEKSIIVKKPGAEMELGTGCFTNSDNDMCFLYKYQMLRILFSLPMKE